MSEGGRQREGVESESRREGSYNAATGTRFGRGFTVCVYDVAWLTCKALSMLSSGALPCSASTVHGRLVCALYNLHKKMSHTGITHLALSRSLRTCSWYFSYVPFSSGSDINSWNSFNSFRSAEFTFCHRYAKCSSSTILSVRPRITWTGTAVDE